MRVFKNKTTRLVCLLSLLTAILSLSQSSKLYSWPQRLGSTHRTSFLKKSYDKNPFYVKTLIENYRYGYIDLTTMMQKTITELYNPLINIKEKPSIYSLLGPSSSNLNPGVSSTLYDVVVGNYPVCDTDIVVHNHKDFDAPVIFGSLPTNPDVKFIPDSSHFPDPTRTSAILKNKLTEAYGELNPSLSIDKACLYPDGDRLVPSLSFIVTIGEKPYNIITDELEIYHFKKLFFSVNGTATIFDKNRTGGLKTLGLSNLDGSGYLSDPNFYTSSPSRAYSPSNIFNFEPDTDQFRETSVFKNAQDYYAWFQTLGYSWHDSKKIKLIPNDIIDGDTNNAYFAPRTSDSEDSSIHVGNGDGVILKDLAIDRDVVNHEFGHFIIFSTLKNAPSDSQALVIHEGLADFFVMMRNQSPCLAATVCPQNSTLCMDSCLRTAANSLTLQTAPSEAHLKSLFLSGMLWDLYQTDGIPYEDMLALSFRSVTLLGTSSGYHDLVAAFLVADLANFNMKYCSRILARANFRGLSQYTRDLQCNKNAISNYTNDNAGGTPSKPTSYSSSSSSSGSFCGSLTSPTSSTNSNPPGSTPVVLMGLSPLLICLYLLRRKEKEATSI